MGFEEGESYSKSNPKIEKQGLFIERLDGILGFSSEEVVGQLYGDLPYHNFNHALGATEKALELVDRCQRYGLEVKELVVALATLFHDAGYQHDHRKQGFTSKEEYSAHIAGQELDKLGFPVDVIQEIKSCIMSTKQDVLYISNEDKIVRAADLASMADDYESFIRNNELLREEYNLLNDTVVNDENWKENTKKIIEFYLGQDIRLTPEHDDESGDSVFHKNVRVNLERFLAC